MIRTTSKKISTGAFPVSYYSSSVYLFLCVSCLLYFLPKSLSSICAWEAIQGTSIFNKAGW